MLIKDIINEVITLSESKEYNLPNGKWVVYKDDEFNSWWGFKVNSEGDQIGEALFAAYKRELLQDIKQVDASDPKYGLEEGMAWAKSGNKVVRKFRCSGGPRHGRIVSKPAQCFAPPDIKKRHRLKITKAKLGKRMARKSKKTKRVNPASKRVQAMNKRSR